MWYSKMSIACLVYIGSSLAAVAAPQENKPPPPVSIAGSPAANLGPAAVAGPRRGTREAQGALSDSQPVGYSSAYLSGPVLYKPPAAIGASAPKTRVGGGTRGGSTLFAVQVFAPGRSGKTVTSQPTLYWYVSGPPSRRIEVSLVDPELIEPVLELQLDGPNRQSLRWLSLKEHGVQLEAGKEYEWYVAVVTDEQRRSADVVAGATVVYVPPLAQVVRAIAGAPAAHHARIYAQWGLWYDAFHATSRLFMTSGDALHHAQRNALLAQVELPGLRFVR